MWDRARPHDTRAALFGGRGEVRVWNLPLSGACPPFQVALACELEAGGRVGKHVQQECGELVLFVTGDGRVWIDGREHNALTGVAIALPLGASLAIENLSAEHSLRYFIIKAHPPTP